MFKYSCIPSKAFQYQYKTELSLKQASSVKLYWLLSALKSKLCYYWYIHLVLTVSTITNIVPVDIVAHNFYVYLPSLEMLLNDSIQYRC